MDIQKLIDRATRGPTAQVVTLTSGLAEQLITRHVSNRDIRPGRVTKYRTDMLAGHWTLNGQAIIIDKNGALIDGRHRLTAIIGTDAAIQTLLVVGVEPDAMTTIDQALPRTAGDYLGIKGEANPRTAASIARLRLAYENNEREALKDTARPTNAEVLGYFEEHHDDIATSARLAAELQEHSKSLVAPAALGFVHNVLAEIDATEAEKYIRQVAKGEELHEGDPAFSVRTRLLNMGRTGAAKKASVIMTGWNAYRTHRTVKNIRVSDRLPSLAS